MFFRKGPRATPRKPARSDFGFGAFSMGNITTTTCPSMIEHISLNVLKVFHLGRAMAERPVVSGCCRLSIWGAEYEENSGRAERTWCQALPACLLVI